MVELVEENRAIQREIVKMTRENRELRREVVVNHNLVTGLTALVGRDIEDRVSTVLHAV